MASCDIRDIQSFFTSPIKETHISKITSAGDNYGSLIYAVDVTTQDGCNLRMVAKMVPENEYLQEFFQTQITFRNEVGFYKTIAPCLQEFQRERGFTKVIDSFPGFLGARFGLDPSSTKVDKHAVLLMKNITEDGFATIDRTLGFNLEQAEAILQKMAELHATFLGLSLSKPELFEAEFKQFFPQFLMFETGEDATNQLIEALLYSIKDDEFCNRNLDKIKLAIVNTLKTIRGKNSLQNKGKFVSLMHCDMWTNNIMLKTSNEKRLDVKFIDFQIYEQSSLARDVIFFIYSSVQIPAIEQHCDDLLILYFNSFLNCLKKLKIDTTDYSFEDFLKEVADVVRQLEFGHIMLMIGSIYASKDNVNAVEEVTLGDMISQRAQCSPAAKERCKRVLTTPMDPLNIDNQQCL